MAQVRLPAEWEAQDAVLLTWPHADTDWRDILERAEATYFAILEQLLNAVNVIIAVSPSSAETLGQEIQTRFADKPFQARCFPVPSNDTWARDHGAITVEQNGVLCLKDFTFNGWGGKFEAGLDNQISGLLHAQGCFAGLAIEPESMILEGGAIESDGAGTLLTTGQCLLNPNRNPQMDKTAVEAALHQTLGAEHVLWLEHGYLAGDDTDSHIDTLARLAPGDVITYVSCDDPDDEHYGELAAMKSELEQLRTRQGQPFTLIALPWPSAKFDAEGHRLPATYANFLITNDLVLVPTYQDAQDDKALRQVSLAFPGRKVVGVDCLALIEQHGSLHCITMQFPKGSVAVA